MNRTVIYYGIFTVFYIGLAIFGHGFWEYLGIIMAILNAFLAGYIYEN